MKILMNKNTNDVNDTSPTYKALEEGSSNQTKEELVQMAQRQQKFIQALQAALVRTTIRRTASTVSQESLFLKNAYVSCHMRH